MVQPRSPRPCVVLLVLGVLLLCAQGAGATTIWSFDVDLEGWTPGFPPYGGELLFRAGEGNPGGCAEVRDDCPGCGSLPVIAPLDYPVDLGAYGSIIYDFYLSQYAERHATLVLTGGDGTVYQYTPSEPMVTEMWVTHEVLLTSQWWIRTQGTAGFAAVLSSVASFAVDLDVSINEHTDFEGWLDNVTLVDGMASACCDPISGGCSLLSYLDCHAAGGIYLPYLPSCSPSPCTMAACCDPQTSVCRLMPEQACAEWGGYFMPAMTSCDPDPCLLAACCDSYAGTCQILRAGDCWEFGGMFLEGYASCEPNPCVPSVCCDPQTGACSVVMYSDCVAMGGTFGPGITTCAPNPCFPAACCNPVTHTCTVLHVWDCEVEGGVFLVGWPCQPNPCDLGACCDVLTGSCTFGPAYDCYHAGGDFQTEWGSCSPNPCAPVACCVPPERNCELMLWRDCEALGGFYSIYINSCDPSPCIPDPARCSVDPWDAYGKAFMSPGTQSTVDRLTVTLVTPLGNWVPGADVSIELWDCADRPICVDSPLDGLRGVTDVTGRVFLNPRVGGCAACSVVVMADGIPIRTYPSLASPDWDGTQADGRVDSADQAWFSAAGAQEPCADYDGDGLKTTVEMSMFATALNRDANTNPLCIRIDVEEPSGPIDPALSLRVARNPSSGQLRILFGVAKEGMVRIDLFDAGGRLVRELLNEWRQPGPHEVAWDGSGLNSAGPAGIYFVRLSGPDGMISKKAVLIR